MNLAPISDPRSALPVRLPIPRPIRPPTVRPTAPPVKLPKVCLAPSKGRAEEIPRPVAPTASSPCWEERARVPESIRRFAPLLIRWKKDMNDVWWLGCRKGPHTLMYGG